MLLDNSPFNRVVTLGQMSLGNSLLRHEAISNNIANVDTPFYKRKMIAFEAELNRVLKREKEIDPPFASTNQRHIPFSTKKHFTSVVPKIYEEFDTNFRNDKNNVDIEKEVSDLVKNNFYFQSVTRSISEHFVRIKSVLA